MAQSANEGLPEEEDLFVARAALQLLAVGKANMLDEKLEDLQELLQSYESMVRRGLPDTPLLHFINLLVKVGPPPAVAEPAVCTLHCHKAVVVVATGIAPCALCDIVHTALQTLLPCGQTCFAVVAGRHWNIGP